MDIYEPITTATLTATRVDGSIAVIYERYEDLEAGPYSSRLKTREGKILDVGYYAGCWLVFEEQ